MRIRILKYTTRLENRGSSMKKVSLIAQRHVCPINTRIINHHVYKHTYSPCYTCTEENEVCDMNPGCCNNIF